MMPERLRHLFAPPEFTQGGCPAILPGWTPPRHYAMPM